MRFGRNAGVAAGGGQGQNCMVRIIEGVNDVMRGAGMVWVLLIDLEGNRARPGLQAIALLLSIDHSEERQRVKSCRVQIIWIVSVNLFHRGRVGRVTSTLVALAVKQFHGV